MNYLHHFSVYSAFIEYFHFLENTVNILKLVDTLDTDHCLLLLVKDIEDCLYVVFTDFHLLSRLREDMQHSSLELLVAYFVLLILVEHIKYRFVLLVQQIA